MSVFICHASEDKERFVVSFATRLRKQGVDAWLDKWEMLPGDSLVERVFNDGLQNATAIVVVLSKVSVTKPWVREELSYAFMKRLNSAGSVRIIPVIINVGVEVPGPLAATLYETIQDLEQYDDAFERILASITGASVRPPLGSTPIFLQPSGRRIGNMDPGDETVIRTICEMVLTEGRFTVVAEAVTLVRQNMGWGALP